MNSANSNNTIHDRRNKVIAKGNVSGNASYIAKAEGAILQDVEGREILDFGGGIAVMNVGHSHPKVVKAIQDQAAKFTHTCFMVSPYESAVRLAEKLCDAAPGNSEKAVMFANSGAEAVENAVKIARYYTKKQAVISFDGGFHGRTLLGMSLTSKIKPYKYALGPFAPEVYKMPYASCYRCQFNKDYPDCNLECADHLEHVFINTVAPEQTAAIIVEPVQGEGGFIAPPKEYFKRLKAICEKHDVLFIADEIQTGIGRTGHMFAMDYYGVEPDITTSAKSLAAGMPLSAVIGKKEIMDSVHASGIGGTYGGNPLCCEAALAVFDIFESENLMQRSVQLGETLNIRFKAFQEKYSIIGDVRGLGPMIAMELVKDRGEKTPATEETKALVKHCFDNDLLILACGTYGNIIRFLMPLVITDEQLEQGLSIVESGLATICK